MARISELFRSAVDFFIDLERDSLKSRLELAREGKIFVPSVPTFEALPSMPMLVRFDPQSESGQQIIERLEQQVASLG